MKEIKEEEVLGALRACGFTLVQAVTILKVSKAVSAGHTIMLTKIIVEKLKLISDETASEAANQVLKEMEELLHTDDNDKTFGF